MWDSVSNKWFYGDKLHVEGFLLYSLLWYTLACWHIFMLVCLYIHVNTLTCSCWWLMSCLPVSRFRCWCWYICMLMFGVDKFMLSAYMFLLVCLHVDVGMFMCYCSFGMFTCWCWYVYVLLLILYVYMLMLVCLCIIAHFGIFTCWHWYVYKYIIAHVGMFTCSCWYVDMLL